MTRHPRVLLLLLAPLVLSAAACAGREAYDDIHDVGGFDFGEVAAEAAATPLTSERQVINALTDAHVGAAERSAVLAAFDAMQATQKSFADVQAGITSRRRALDPHLDRYVADSDALAAEQADVYRQRAQASATFRHAAATALDGAEWKRFEASLQEQSQFRGRHERGGDGYGGRPSRR